MRHFVLCSLKEQSARLIYNSALSCSFPAFVISVAVVPPAVGVVAVFVAASLGIVVAGCCRVFVVLFARFACSLASPGSFLCLFFLLLLLLLLLRSPLLFVAASFGIVVAGCHCVPVLVLARFACSLASLGSCLSLFFLLLL